MDKSNGKRIERRGGARPNTGGKREGSGRKKIIQGEVVMWTWRTAADLDEELLKFSDRGFKSKSEYANYLARKGLQSSVD